MSKVKPKKRLIIRESDLKKLPKSFVDKYESVNFTPFTRHYFEKRVTYYTIKGKEYLVKQYLHYEYPESLLKRMTGVKLHSNEYKYWLCKYDEQGQLMIRAGLRQPESRLGFVTLKEKDEQRSE
jgi:hypothetical protein